MIEKLAGEPPHLGEQPRGEDRHHHNFKIIIITCRCKNYVKKCEFVCFGVKILNFVYFGVKKSRISVFLVSAENGAGVKEKSSSPFKEDANCQVSLVQTKDFGSYICIASNQWGETRHQVRTATMAMLMMAMVPYLCIFIMGHPCTENWSLIILIGVVIINDQVLLGPPSRPNPPSRVQVHTFSIS